MGHTISPGTIVWVSLGPRGGYKDRPAVAINNPDSDGNLFVIVCTTQLGREPPEMEVELPSSAPIRHSLTKLKKRTVALLNWTEEVSVSSIREVGGDCPGPILLDIKQKLRALAQRQHREPNRADPV